ncbi:MAG: hypothetical protein LUD43_04800, partial [Firmicutes bacterium]|nr:hypothetical protein [Bacillota bacterium]
TVAGARKCGFDVIILPAADGMDAPVGSLPDMTLYAGFGRLFVRKAHMNDAAFSEAVSDALRAVPSLSLTVTDDLPSDCYPDDVKFNCFTLCGCLFGKLSAVSPHILAAAKAYGVMPVNVAQGYAKCSSCVFGDRAVITSDTSIYCAVKAHGGDAYLIGGGNIALPGYGDGNDGFIGGASFYAGGTLYFLGDVDFHPDCGIMKEAAARHGAAVVSLSDENLFDSGCLYLE